LLNIIIIIGGVFVLSGLAYSKKTDQYKKGEIKIEKFDDRLNSYARAFPIERNNQTNNPSIVVYDVPWYMKLFQNKAVDPLTFQTIIG
jgi:hypothetical protein